MKPAYRRTMTACFLGYIVQAIVNNFAPLLFVMFQQDYGIPLSKITLLIALNFLIQLCIDLLSTFFCRLHRLSCLGPVGARPCRDRNDFAGLFTVSDA